MNRSGERFAGRYEVEHELGSGGFGRVYLVNDRLSGRSLALKELVAEHVRRRGLTALAREFRLLTRLRHPNLVEVYDFGLEPSCFFTMEHVPGAPLQHAGLDEDELVDVIAQVCRALEYVHRRGVVHLDVKPSNVLVRFEDRAPVAKLTDFGIATDVPGRVRGYTLGFVAPEVLEGRAFDGRADLFSLGMTLLSVASPESADTSTIAVTTGEGERHQRPAPTLDVLPPRLAPIVERLLRADPAERYGSAAQVIEALSAATRRSIAVETAATRVGWLRGARLTGRDPELGRLQEAWRAARDGGTGALVLLGPAGVGKSRLLRELVVQAQLDGARVADVQASGATWSAVAALLTQLVGGRLPDLEPAHRAELARLLPELGGAGAVDDRDADASRQRLAAAVVATLRAVAEARPTLLAVEDLHDHDDATVLLLRRAVEAALPGLLVVATTRGANADLGEALPLAPFGAAEVRALVADVLGEGVLPDGFLDELTARSGGTPLYVCEALGLLADRDVLIAGSAGWWCDADGLAAASLPEDVDALVDARLALLSPSLRTLLVHTAILGGRFGWEALEAVTRSGSVRADLADLVGRRLLVADGAGFRFAHALVHDAALRLVARDPDREARHRRLAEALAGHAHPAEVARLYEASDTPSAAVPWLVDAAERAMAVFEHGEAVRLLDRALARAGAAGALHLRRLRAIRRGGLGDADPRGEEALIAVSDARERIEVQRLAGMAHYSRGELETALRWLDRAHEAAREAGDPVLLAGVLDDRGFVRGYAGELEQARADHADAVALLGPDGSEAVRAEARNHLGFACWALGRYDEALLHLREALALRRALGDVRGEGVSRNNIGNVLRHRGDLEGAIAEYDAAIELCRASGDVLYEAIALNNLGQCEEELDAFDRALALYEAALARVRSIGDRIREGDNLGNIGICHLHRGDAAAAREWLSRSVEHRGRIGDRTYLVLDRSWLAVAKLGAGDPAGARVDAEEALAAVDGQTGIEQVQAVFLNGWRVLEALGDPRAAEVLDRAAAVVRAQAAAVADPEVRRALLRRIRVNREIVAACRTLGLQV